MARRRVSGSEEDPVAQPTTVRPIPSRPHINNAMQTPMTTADPLPAASPCRQTAADIAEPQEHGVVCSSNACLATLALHMQKSSRPPPSHATVALTPHNQSSRSRHHDVRLRSAAPPRHQVSSDIASTTFLPWPTPEPDELQCRRPIPAQGYQIGPGEGRSDHQYAGS